MHFEISLIFGYPGEDTADFRKTMAFIAKNKKIIPKIAQANPFINYLDSQAYNWSKKIETQERMNKFLDMIKTEKIKYTKSFIGNLLYS